MYEKAKADPKTFEMIKARERAHYEYNARLALLSARELILDTFELIDLLRNEKMLIAGG